MMPRAASRCILVLVAALALPVAALASNGKKGDSVGQDALDAATQPLSDLGLRKRRIPLILLRAEEQPYALDGLGDCDAVRAEIALLERVLGPDADAPRKQSGAINKGLKLGGRMLGGFIPFRGLVREFSGANTQRERWESAIYSGVARRSYLKGYGQGLTCASPREHAVQSAQDLLGMTPPKPPPKPPEEATAGSAVAVPGEVPAPQ